jgi:hypothetical protein
VSGLFYLEWLHKSFLKVRINEKGKAMHSIDRRYAWNAHNARNHEIILTRSQNKNRLSVCFLFNINARQSTISP